MSDETADLSSHLDQDEAMRLQLRARSLEQSLYECRRQLDQATGALEDSARALAESTAAQRQLAADLADTRAALALREEELEHARQRIAALEADGLGRRRRGRA